MSVAAIILAGGKGTRMKSDLPKALHPVAGRPMVEHVIRTVQTVGVSKIVIVVGHQAQRVQEALSDLSVEFALQEPQLGTGHAVMQAAPLLANFEGSFLVLNGDAPLLSTGSLEGLLEKHHQENAGLSLLTYEVADPMGLGRIIRDEQGRLLKIVEHKDANTTELSIHEVNPSNFLFNNELFDFCSQLNNDNAAAEYYLTDVISLYRQANKTVLAITGDDESKYMIGINDRYQLSQADFYLRQRIRRKWMAAGVSMIHPESIFIDDGVELAPDVMIEPNVHLKGACKVASGVRIPANCMLEDIHVNTDTLLESFKSYKAL